MHFTNIPLREEKGNDQSVVPIHQSIQKKSTTLNKNQKYNASMSRHTTGCIKQL
jgi:hypothetical protein